MTFLHVNEKWSASYDFKSVVDDTLGLYECTGDEIKKIIKDELQKIEYNSDSGTFGPYAHKIKKFSKSLRSILTKQR